MLEVYRQALDGNSPSCVAEASTEQAADANAASEMVATSLYSTASPMVRDQARGPATASDTTLNDGQRSSQHVVLAMADQVAVSFTNFATIWLLSRCDDTVFAAITLAGQFINYSRSAIERLLSAAYAALIHGRQVNQAGLTGSSLLHAGWFTAAVTFIATGCALAYWSRSDSPALAFGLLTQCLVLPCQMLRDHLRSVSLSRLRVGFAFGLDIVACLIQLSLMIGLVYKGWTDSLSISLAWAAGNLLFVALWFAKPPIQFLISRSQAIVDWRNTWSYSKWLVLGRGLGIASYLIVPWLLALLHGETQCALFGKAFTLVGLSVMVVVGLNSYFQPLSIRAFHSQGSPALRASLRSTIALFTVLLLGLCGLYFVFGNQLMNLVFKTTDPLQGWVVSLLGLNVLAFSYAIVAGNGLAALKQSRANFWGEISNFAVSCLVAIPLVMTFATPGAALAILLGSLAAAWVTNWQLRRSLAEYDLDRRKLAATPS
jgi:O-antigen/teichoic acid export membrane protein